MKFTKIEDQTAFFALEKEWNDLCDRSDHFYFQTFSWMKQWWRFNSKTRQIQLNILVGWNKDKPVLIWPLVIEKKKRGTRLEWMGADLNDYCDVIMDNTVESPFNWMAGAWDIIEKTPKIDLIRLDRLRSDSMTTIFLKKNSRKLTRVSTSPYVNIEQWQTWGSYFEHHKKNLQVKTHARRMRGLAKKGKVSFEVNPPDRTGEIIQTMMAQKTARMATKGQSGIHQSKRFVEFLTETALVAQSDNTLHLSVLKVDDRVIACHLGFLYRQTLYWFVPSFDPEYARYSPGRALLEKILKWSFENSVNRFDFLLGDETYKYQWTDRQIHLHGFLYPMSVKGYLYVRWRTGRLRPLLKRVYSCLGPDVKLKIRAFLK